MPLGLDKVFGQKYIEFLRKVRRGRKYVAYGVFSEGGIIKKYKLSDNADAPNVLGLLTKEGYLIFAVGSDSDNVNNLPEIQGQKILQYSDAELHELVLKYLNKGALVDEGEFTWKIKETDLNALIINTGSDLHEFEFSSGDYKFMGYSENGVVGIVIPSWMRQIVQEYIQPNESYFIIGRKKTRTYEGKEYTDYRVMGLWL